MNQVATVTNHCFSRQEWQQFRIKISHLLHLHSTHQTYGRALCYTSILSELREPKPLQQLHAQMITSGLSNNTYLLNKLMSSYSSCGLITDSERIFHHILHKNLFTWTITISGFAKHGLFIKAVYFFGLMVINGFIPNAVTISSILPAIGHLGLLLFGKSVHCFWIRQGFESNIFVETSLVTMYSHFGDMHHSRHLFDEMARKNIVTWNAIISGYSDNGYAEEALRVFHLMRATGVLVDCFTIMSLLSASLIIGCLKVGSLIHGFTIKTGWYECDAVIKTAIMDVYVSQSSIDDAYRVFTELPILDVVSWTLMLKAFSSGGYWRNAIELFNEMMRLDRVQLDSVALISVISSCKSSGSLQQGKRAHVLTVKLGFGTDTFVGSSLIDMYANCGNLGNARRIFEEMQEKDIVCWNAMISAYGMSGYANHAIDLFWEMMGSNLTPNQSTFMGVLSACSHAGTVIHGLRFFDLMVKYWHIVPNLQHYACVVDLLGRAGRLDEARIFIDNMPLKPDSDIYIALVAACRVYSNVDLGLQFSQKLVELEPNDAGYHILLSNMHALVGDWDSVNRTRNLRLSKVKKDPGFSSIEISCKVYMFMAGRKDHLHYIEINMVLEGLLLLIKDGGYAPVAKFMI